MISMLRHERFGTPALPCGVLVNQYLLQMQNWNIKGIEKIMFRLIQSFMVEWLSDHDMEGSGRLGGCEGD
jgi:hypothetical protein